ncbi:MAG TPA: RNase adaptor protein RapZ, partial [Desulfobulbaceae bacterium]|nr:RNase adaptor protein RapZ [Desulfobulbaceae bacterium]
GGCHRSVAMVAAIASHLRGLGFEVMARHRDLACEA